jgi:hypothetical protein
MTGSLTRTPEKSEFSSTSYHVHAGPTTTTVTTTSREANEMTELGQRILTGYSTPV